MNDIIAATSFAQKEAILKSEKVQSLLALADPGDKSREHAGLGASSSITDILETLLQDWKAKTKKLEDEETARKELYDRTSAEMRQMITDTEEAIKTAKIQLSETKATLATTKGQLTETKANLHDDNKYLKDLTAQCEAKAKEWDQRSAMRAGELKALETAIDIVGGTASNAATRGYTDNTASLLQGGAAPADSYTDVVFTQLKEVKKSSQNSRAQQARLDAVTQIKHAAKKLNSADMSLLAMKIAADPFAKVKELIQQLIE